MPFQPREAGKIIETARTRLAAMQQIDARWGRVIDYGDFEQPLTKTELRSKVAAVEEDISTYNQAVDLAGALRDRITGGEDTLAGMSATVLDRAKTKFGRDSSEAGQISGKRPPVRPALSRS